jgi:energy-coupling factor transport system ATP-binding protein
MTALATTPIADIRGVSYWYPHASEPVLRGVDWEIAAGEFLLLAGPSGSGKSTLLRCLNGLVPHFSGGKFAGSVVVAGLDTRDHGPRDLAGSVGFVFQDPEAQSVSAIVEDDIAFGLEQAGVPRAVMRKRVEEVLDLLGIAKLRSREISTLSGGERQRVAIASALVMHPRLLVLDEPTSQLDPWGAEEVFTALQRLNDDLGISIVLAEHRLDRVTAHADRMRVFDRAGGMTEGEPAAMLRQIPAGDLPPIARLALELEWPEIPLTLKAARSRLPRFEPAPKPVRATPTGAPIVQVERVSVDRGRSRVLQDCSLEIRPGELVAVMGRNGSGKTTLLRALLGLVEPSSGAIRVAGRDLAGGRAEQLAGFAGYLPQDPAKLLFAETVRAELEFTLKHRPSGLDWSPRQIDLLLERLDLLPLADRHPRDLSVGERERAAIAAVLVAAPRLLVLDEPTRGMDGQRKQALARLLAEERANGAAIVMATHDVESVAELATRVLLLADGEVIADGAPESVLAGSLTYSTQMNKLLGGTILTVSDALASLRGLGMIDQDTQDA